MSRSVFVIANPASGKPQPILHTLNRIFREAGVDWDLALTKESGDAHRLAAEAAAKGFDVVAAFGGDGTIMEAAQGLFGTEIPLAILPGGTANLMSVELGIPKNLGQAAKIACDPNSRVCKVDIGKASEVYFMLRVGIGFSARTVEYADRELKTRYGVLAYTIAGIKALKAVNRAHYRFLLDGRPVEIEGVSCLIDNAGNMGIPGSGPVPNMRIDDGLFDVIVLRPNAYLSVNSRTLTSNRPYQEVLDHWQASRITVETDPTQPAQFDGEVGYQTPLDIEVIPGAISILAPA